jgi:hypothetical protein
VTASKTIVGPQQRFEIHGVRLSRHIPPHGVAILADFVASGVITLTGDGCRILCWTNLTSHPSTQRQINIPKNPVGLHCDRFMSGYMLGR